MQGFGSIGHFFLFAVALFLVGAVAARRVARAQPPANDDQELAVEARALGRVLDHIFERVEASLKEGMTTRSIDELVQTEIKAAGVKSSFLGYNGFPAYCTASINEEVVNTIPSERRLQNGDLLKLQIGIAGKLTFAIRGWTYAIGPSTEEDRRLIAVGRAALRRATATARIGARIGDIGFAIQETVENAGFNVDRQFIGHRIGRSPHQGPPIPGYGAPGRGVRLKPNWVLSLVAIVHAGSPSISIAEDRWNAVAQDGRRSVLFSDMVLVQDAGGELLTQERP